MEARRLAPVVDMSSQTGQDLATQLGQVPSSAHLYSQKLADWNATDYHDGSVKARPEGRSAASGW